MTTSGANVGHDDGAIYLDDNFTREDVLKLITPAVVEKLRTAHQAVGRASIAFCKHTPPQPPVGNPPGE